MWLNCRFGGVDSGAGDALVKRWLVEVEGNGEFRMRAWNGIDITELRMSRFVCWCMDRGLVSKVVC